MGYRMAMLTETNYQVLKNSGGGYFGGRYIEPKVIWLGGSVLVGSSLERYTIRLNRGRNQCLSTYWV